MTDEDYDDELETAKELVMALNRLLIDRDNRGEVERVEGREEDEEPADFYGFHTDDGRKTMEQFEDRYSECTREDMNEDESRGAADGFYVAAGRLDQFEDMNEHTNEDESEDLDGLLMVDGKMMDQFEDRNEDVNEGESRDLDEHLAIDGKSEYSNADESDDLNGLLMIDDEISDEFEDRNEDVNDVNDMNEGVNEDGSRDLDGHLVLDGQTMYQFEERNEDMNIGFGFDGPVERFEEKYQSTNQNESSMELQQSECNGDGWEGWAETDPNDNDFSFPVNFDDGKPSDPGSKLADVSCADNARFGSFVPLSERHNEGDGILFQSPFGVKPPANLPAAKRRPEKSRLTVATSFSSRAAVGSEKKRRPKIKIRIGGAPAFEPSKVKTSEEEMFFVAQRWSPRCGDGASLFGGHGSSLLSPTLSEAANNALAGKATTAKGTGNRAKPKLNIRGYLNGAYRSSKQQRGIHIKDTNPSPSAAGLLAAPSGDCLQSNDNVEKKTSKGQFFVTAPATSTMDSYSQIKVMETPRQKKVGDGPSGAKKSRNLLQRIKAPLVGRTRITRNAAFGLNR